MKLHVLSIYHRDELTSFQNHVHLLYPKIKIMANSFAAYAYGFSHFLAVIYCFHGYGQELALSLLLACFIILKYEEKIAKVMKGKKY